LNTLCVHAETFASAVAVHAERHDYRERHYALALAHLHVGRVDPTERWRRRLALAVLMFGADTTVAWGAVLMALMVLAWP
jgi:hypothetical protein